MKDITLLLISFTSCLSLPSYCQDNFLITGNSVGDITIGDLESNVREQLKSSRLEEITWLKHYNEKYYTVSENGQPTMTIKFYDGKVYGIEVYSDRYHTDFGLKVGYGFKQGRDRENKRYGHEYWSIMLYEAVMDVSAKIEVGGGYAFIITGQYKNGFESVRT